MYACGPPSDVKEDFSSFASYVPDQYLWDTGHATVSGGELPTRIRLA